MKFSAHLLACSTDLEKTLEVQRQSQYVFLRDLLTKAAESDINLFCSYCLHILPPHLWTLIEDLERIEERREKTKSKRLQAQLSYFQASLIKSLVSAMLYREKGESYNVKLLEVIETLEG